ncbi:MAG: hypothetical protein MNPFHGCM_02767 [Gemmatimonadaceae bacterium]|nr:hypothetical protein [Gemmatimonadaceae bacterium]
MSRFRQLSGGRHLAVATVVAAGWGPPPETEYSAASAEPRNHSAAPVIVRTPDPVRQIIPSASVLDPPRPTAPDSEYALIPIPRELAPRPVVPIGRGVAVIVPPNSHDRFAAADLTSALRERGVSVRSGAPVRIVLTRRSLCPPPPTSGNPPPRCDAALDEEGYELRTAPARVEIVANSAAGLFYGVQTLKQLLTGSGMSARILGATIRDWPAMRWRGVQDDLSRGPVPTLAYQKAQIQRFAELKLNVYSPYFEHTLAYAANPLIAPRGGALTREDVRELVAFAAQRHIVIVPEQEAFGHLHHVLKYETYSPLGVIDKGHVLAPDDSSAMSLIASWFAEIDTLFPGPFVHIGADETFELGRGRSRAAVDSLGMGRVYIDFLTRIERVIRRPGKRLLFWGDVAENHPELVRDLPGDMIAVAWNYWSRDGFARQIEPYRAVGMDTWVAPGVNNWNRVYPNFAIGLANIQGFVRDGQRLGSSGVLNTTWDDDGDTLFEQVWYGVAFGAAASWQQGESRIDVFQRAFGRAIHNDTTGGVDEAQRHLMMAHQVLDSAGLGEADNYLFWLDPWSAEGRHVASKLLPAARELRLHAEQAIVALARARSQPGLRNRSAIEAMELGARRIDGIGMKFQMSELSAQAYADAFDFASGAPSAVGRELGEMTGIGGWLDDIREMYALTGELYREAWGHENRPYWITNVTARFDASTQLWISRIDKVRDARREFGRTRRLPAAAELGIPAPLNLPLPRTIL